MASQSHDLITSGSRRMAPRSGMPRTAAWETTAAGTGTFRSASSSKIIVIIFRRKFSFHRGVSIDELGLLHSGCTVETNH